MTAVIDLDRLQLAAGSHSDGPPPGDPNCQMCLFEAYNALITPPDELGQLTDDCPDDVSPVLHRFGIRLNDMLPDDKRQQLKQYLPNPDGTPSPLSGTRHDGLDDIRRWMAADWAVRTATPRWFDLAGLTDQAAQLRALAPIVDAATYNAARPVVYAARDEAWKFRRARLDQLRADVKAKYQQAGAVAGAVAAAGAAAGAVAGAVAAAVAAAGAVAVAVAVAVAAAGAVAVAVAVAAAAAAAGAVAGAVAAAGAAAGAVAAAGAAAGAVAAAGAAAGASWSVTYRKVYDTVLPILKAKYQPLTDQLHDEAIDLYARMIRPETPA